MHNMSISHRLKQARVAAGFKSVREACTAFKWNYPTYAGHENGSRAPSADKAREYAAAFKVSSNWILFGEDRDGLSHQSTTTTASSSGLNEPEALFIPAPQAKTRDERLTAFSAAGDHLAFGILKGDTLYLDMSGNQETGDLIIANMADENGSAHTIIRRYAHPYLIPASRSQAILSILTTEAPIMGTIRRIEREAP